MKKELLTIMCLTVALTITGCGHASTSTYEREIEELETENEELESENKELKKEIKELKAQLYGDESSQSEQSTETSELDGFVAETSGVCGADLKWEFGNGILRISGTGEMADYRIHYGNRPWEEIVNKINHVYVDEGCTYIGEEAFGEIAGLSKVILPHSVESTGEKFLYNNHNVRVIIWGDDEYNIKDSTRAGDVESEIKSDGHQVFDMWGYASSAAPAEEAPAEEAPAEEAPAEEAPAEEAPAEEDIY